MSDTSPMPSRKSTQPDPTSVAPVPLPGVPPYGTTAWNLWRRGVLGASEVGAACGLSSLATPLDIWLRKIGEEPDDTDTPAMRQGRAFEDTIARLYAEDTGLRVWGDGRASWAHPTEPWLVATPDRFAAPARQEVGEMVPDRLVQIKATGWYHAAEWGRAGSDELPLGYIAQVTTEMAVMGVPRCDVPRFVWGQPLAIYVVHFDAEFWAALLARARAFWALVCSRTAPPLDGGSAAWGWLKGRFPEDHDPMREAPPEAEALVHAYAAASQAAKEAEHEKERAQQALCEIIGPAAGIYGPWGRATWKRRASGGTDWQALANDLAAALDPPGVPPGLVEKHKRPGSRTFHLALSKKETKT